MGEKGTIGAMAESEVPIGTDWQIQGQEREKGTRNSTKNLKSCYQNTKFKYYRTLVDRSRGEEKRQALRGNIQIRLRFSLKEGPERAVSGREKPLQFLNETSTSRIPSQQILGVAVRAP